jgi:2-oxoglutarate dehydrogenase complex dehydrogenase (E1) component-like enzyme
MGAWGYLCLTQSQYGWKYAGRRAAASPATGYPKAHEQEQQALVAAAFS